LKVFDSWIDIGKGINNKFLIQIPKFKPKDIALLFIQFEVKNKKTREYELNEGSILKQIKYNRVLDALMEEKYYIKLQFRQKYGRNYFYRNNILCGKIL